MTSETPTSRAAGITGKGPGRTTAPLDPLRIPRGLWLLAAALILVLSAVTLLRHAYFLTTAWDMGYYVQAVWAIAHGSWMNSVSGFHVFADHFSPIMILLAPLAYLSTPEGLLIVQAAAIGSTVVPAYRIGARLRGDRLGWMCAAWMGLSANVWHTAMYDFRPATIGFAALVWLIAVLEDGRRTWLIVVLAGLAVSSREDVALFTGLAVLIHALLTRDRSLALPGVLSIGVSVWYTAAGHRLFAPFDYFLWYRYADYGDGPIEAIQNISYLVPTALERLIRPEVLFAVSALLLPVLILPALRGWRRSWPGFVVIVGNGISAAPLIPTIYYQYYILAVVFIMWGAAHSLADRRGNLPSRAVLYVTAMIFLFAGPILSYRATPFGRSVQDVAGSTGRTVLVELFPKLSPHDSVSAGSAVLPHLAERSHIYSFPLPLVCGDVIQRYAPQTAYPEWVVFRPTDDRHSLNLGLLGYERVGTSELMSVWKSTGAHPPSQSCAEPSDLRDNLFDRIRQAAASG